MNVNQRDEQFLSAASLEKPKQLAPPEEWLQAITQQAYLQTMHLRRIEFWVWAMAMVMIGIGCMAVLGLFVAISR